jgi:alpha-mannosidase
LNQPLYEKSIAAHAGALPEAFSLVSVDRPNAVITAVKRAEDEDALIVRFYEAHDGRGDVTVTVAGGYRRAYLCDLMENTERELAMCDGKVTLPVANFEIITLKFTRT